MEESDLTWRIGKALLRELEIARIDVKRQEQTIGSNAMRDGLRMSATADGAIDDGHPRPKSQSFERFTRQDRLVSTFWQVHRNNVLAIGIQWGILSGVRRMFA